MLRRAVRSDCKSQTDFAEHFAIGPVPVRLSFWVTNSRTTDGKPMPWPSALNDSFVCTSGNGKRRKNRNFFYFSYGLNRDIVPCHIAAFGRSQIYALWRLLFRKKNNIWRKNIKLYSHCNGRFKRIRTERKKANWYCDRRRGLIQCLRFSKFHLTPKSKKHIMPLG